MNVTEVPAHIAPVGFELIFTVGVTEGIIVTDVVSLALQPLASVAVTV